MQNKSEKEKRQKGDKTEEEEGEGSMEQVKRDGGKRSRRKKGR